MTAMGECRCAHASNDVSLLANRIPTTWLHYGIVPSAGRRPELYGELRNVACELTEAEQINEFFFMHKPPGLRVRFQSTGGSLEDLDEVLRERLTGWRRDGVVAGWHGGVYEPEEFLFGGRDSMRYVHRIFMADSLAWLGYHVAPGDDPAWAMSLLMVRVLLDALEILGWEDLDVWDRLRWQAGRRFAEDGEIPSQCQRIVGALRNGWSARDRLTELLSPGARRLVEEYRAVVAEIGKHWRDAYFTVGRPAIGPREAAAFVIVFHWNRAGLSRLHQTLIADGLAARPGVTP